ncbi:hypothetical protein P43SY_010912 [Pythium insidiosum]|uniref:Transmembrane protein n=1 Tax=Pythium insidiosum TaxID=114742 RepID=A0AAD5L7N4_PYTIN|nr:hypothetical protein P43SY_010912 [Pythium insidiosum]
MLVASASTSSPPSHSVWPNNTPEIPIAPAPYAFLIWLVIFALTAVHAIVDCFFPLYSVYKTADNPTFLRICFAVSWTLNMLWGVLNNRWLWINVATVDLLLSLLAVAPIYLFLTRESLDSRVPSSWRRYLASALAIRMYFAWMCAAVVLCFTMTLQDFHGAYLPFGVYAMMVALLVVIALIGVIYGNDPVIGLVVVWALVGLAAKKITLPGDTQTTLEWLQAAAVVAAPVVGVMIVISLFHRYLADRLGRRNDSRLDAGDLEMMKPLGAFQQPIGSLSFLNAGLLVLQAAVNIAYAKYFVLRAREYETLISPASFAFTIWILIYALEVVLVITDLLYPDSSFYADATQPTQLRATFALTCVLNIAWLILYVKRHVVAATVMIILLWLALLVLYVYSVNDRNSRAAFDWKLYVCSELPIAMYFAWVTMLAFVHLAIALQDSRHAFLTVTTYVTHLTIITVLALLAILYAQDAIFGLVAIWYLIAVSTKHVKLPADLQAGDMAVRACAGEAAGILGAVLVVTFLAMFLLDSTVATDEEASAALPPGQQPSTYGSSSV